MFTPQSMSRPLSGMFVSALVLAALAGVPMRASGQQVLEIYGDSVDSYRASAASGGQDIRPMLQQRGVGVDGSMRAGSTFGWALAGNPSDPGGSVGQTRLGDVHLATGTFAPFEVDLALPAPGMARWVVGRSYSHTQKSTAPAHRNSNGPQGYNWFQTSQPEIVFHDDPFGAANDLVYIVYGAERFVEFKRVGSSSDEFKAMNGAAGVVQHVPGSPDVYIYTDQHGVRTYFFGGNTGSGRADYQVWKIVDPAGNAAYVGDAGSASTAASSGYNTDKTIAVAYDGHTASDGRRYTYGYSSIGGRNRLVSVVAEVKTGGTWASPSGVSEVGRVEYGYYTSNESGKGKTGDLKTVTLTTPLSDSGVSSVKTKYYRYYDDTWDDSDGRRGTPHLIKMVVGYEGCRNFDWTGDITFDGDYLTETDANLKPYAEAYLEYVSNTDDRVASVFMNGQCGCGGGGGAGAHTLSYTASGGIFGVQSYDTQWHRRVTVEQPDGTFATQYFDECGQALSRVVTDGPLGSHTDWWATQVVRDDSGLVTSVRTPANITAYDHSTNAFTAAGGAGLVQRYLRETSGDLTGFVLGSGFSEGTSPTDFTLVSWMVYNTSVLVIGDSGVVRPLVKERWAYHIGTDSDDPGVDDTYYDVTKMEYEWWEEVDDEDVLFITLKSVTMTAPAVDTAKNGSGVANATVRYLRPDGTTYMSQSAEGYRNYTRFENGQLVLSITDCQTDYAGDFTGDFDPLDDFDIPETSEGVRLITEYTYDAQGRRDIVTMPDGHKAKTYYSRIGDRRLATLSFPPYSSSASIWYGPVGYSVANHAGRTELSCTLGISSSGWDTLATSYDQTYWIAEGTSHPLDALHADLQGSSRAFVVNLSTTLHDKPGLRVEEARSYFEVPTSAYGSSGTNFDATTFAYDDMGRRIRTKVADGTITRSAYDVLGRAWQSFVGTNDNGDAGGDTSGTNNMVKVSETEFDGGNDGGNSLVTARTLFVEDSTTGQRVTTFQHDVRGRTIVTENPVAPHVLVKYDNLGRMLASATYSSPSGLDPTDDPTGLTTNRLGLSQTFYDEAGRVWKTQRHKISAGSDADHLATLTWYDKSGRVIKVLGEGVHTKTMYDRLGRATRRFTLAFDDDADYDDVFNPGTLQTDLDGDIVLVEDQTLFEDTTGRALMHVRIVRHHDDPKAGTAGPLDADNDLSLVDVSEIEGRFQITCMVYDGLDRVTHTVMVGTNGGSTFNYPGDLSTTPSATNLVTQTIYNDSGTVLATIDPRTKQTRFEYDDAGRRIAVIANWTGATPPLGTTNRDEDIYTRFVYQNGHQIKMWVDLDGDNAVDTDDQVTEYVYGVGKGASFPDSKIAHGGLLARVIYPPQYTSGGGQPATDRDVWFAYNAQGQEVWRQDQTELEIQQDYDVGGRLTHRRVIAMDTAGDLDTTVRRISYEYTPRGQTETVTQWDDEAPGSGDELDQVKYTFDDWGNMTNIEQDHNGVVGGSGSVDDYEVRWTYDVTAHGASRNMVRRTSQELVYASTSKNGHVFDYSDPDGIGDLVSRVYTLEIASTPIALYTYMGDGTVALSKLMAPGIGTGIDSFASSRTYPHIDRFNRPTRSTWVNTGGSGGAFYEVDIAYDESSNITRVIDNIQIDPGAGGSGAGTHAFDAAYTIDGLNRVARVHEGKWDTSSITTQYRDEQWTLTQTGNWSSNALDLDGDGFFTGTGEHNDTRTHAPVNEILSRNTDSAGGVEFTLAYNLRGDLEDEGGTGGYKYVWDAFGRLVEVRKQNSDLVAAYRYNGLNQRITWHYDADEDADVDGSDPVYHFCYDDKWRIVGTWRGTDTDPKELFIYHAAGVAGMGGSSYIDSVVLRDRDNSAKWSQAADGTLETRHYYAQNWRADVSAIFDNSGAVMEWQKYSAYGVPFLLTPGDHGKDGGISAADQTAFNADYAANHARADLNRDGAWTTADQTLFTASYNAAAVGGRWKLSAHVANRKGYAGYEHEGFGNDLAAPELAHVRHRVLHFGLGRWTRRDPLGYVDGMNSYAFAISSPTNNRDPQGLLAVATGAIECDSEVCSDKCNRNPDSNGHTLCRDGQPCICVCSDAISRRYPDFGDLILACVREHEEWHFRTAKCVFIGIWMVCHPEGTLCSECDAYTVEERCLEETFAACLHLAWKEGRGECLLEVGLRLTRARRNRDLFCQGCWGLPGLSQHLFDGGYCTDDTLPPPGHTPRPMPDSGTNPYPVWPPDIKSP
ncbi:MAG: hypothetical protein KF699_09370 [Phycisphaeraceae bacterium]|nr:hypothetical protein [Phycisphaeraceae bacterium]